MRGSGSQRSRDRSATSRRSGRSRRRAGSAGHATAWSERTTASHRGASGVAALTQPCPQAAPRPHAHAPAAARRTHREALADAQDHRAATHGVQADGPALLPDRSTSTPSHRGAARAELIECQLADSSSERREDLAQRPHHQGRARWRFASSRAPTPASWATPSSITIASTSPVAVAVAEGLVTPVVRNADRLGVLAISQTVRELAGRAKDKKLKPEEMQNGTFSISEPRHVRHRRIQRGDQPARGRDFWPSAPCATNPYVKKRVRGCGQAHEAHHELRSSRGRRRGRRRMAQGSSRLARVLYVDAALNAVPRAGSAGRNSNT